MATAFCLLQAFKLNGFFVCLHKLFWFVFFLIFFILLLQFSCEQDHNLVARS